MTYQKPTESISVPQWLNTWVLGIIATVVLGGAAWGMASLWEQQREIATQATTIQTLKDTLAVQKQADDRLEQLLNGYVNKEVFDQFRRDNAEDHRRLFDVLNQVTVIKYKSKLNKE